MLPLIIDLCDGEARKHKSCDIVEAIQLTYATGMLMFIDLCKLKQLFSYLF